MDDKSINENSRSGIEDIYSNKTILDVLDKTGLQHLWTVIANYLSDLFSKIAANKTAIGNKQDKITGGSVDQIVVKTSTGFGFRTEVGKSTTGIPVITDGENINCAEGAEIFNSYKASSTISYTNIASGLCSHAEGCGTVASGKYSHAEGYRTKASGMYSHAEGISTIASEADSHAEGASTKALGQHSHSEGIATTASGQYSHAEGAQTTASGSFSHAEGNSTTASGSFSHAEGNSTKALGDNSHSEGIGTTASGVYSYAGGCDTVASAAYTRAIGHHTVANKDWMVALGVCNKQGNTNDLFVIGNGNPVALDEDDVVRSNIFRVHYTNGCFSTKAFQSTGADYAEFFLWEDDNPNNEDRIGRFVTLNGDKISLATQEDDYIVGIISGDPSVVGDVHDDQWHDMYLRDVFGRTILEYREEPDQVIEEPDPEDPEKTITHTIPGAKGNFMKINPNYDPNQPYIPRSERPEWGCVGMMGKIVMIDDGTCKPNGFCWAGKDGIATHSDKVTKFRVMTRIDETHIKVVIIP